MIKSNFVWKFRLLKDKEGVRKRLEDEEKEYINRRKECVTNLIKLEQQVMVKYLDRPMDGYSSSKNKHSVLMSN